MSYTKLFNSVLASSIWSEDDQTRIAWITLLAMADQHGEVKASIPGLARMAGISVQDAERAIERFKQPDPYSRTPDHDGRRIEDVDGGWFLLNHAKYRRMASLEDKREKAAERQRRKRERDSHASVTPSNASVTLKPDIAEAEAEAEAEAKTETPKPPKGASDMAFEQLWKTFPAPSRNRSSKKQLKDELKRAKDAPDVCELTGILEAWCKCEQWTKDGGAFVPGAHRWIKNRQWEETPAETETQTQLDPQGRPKTANNHEKCKDKDGVEWIWYGGTWRKNG